MKDTIQIERILEKDSYTKKIFKGVYPKDLLPTVEYPGSYVLNTNPSSSPGEHWVGVHFTDVGSAEYFDSYGLHPIVHGLTGFLDLFLIMALQFKGPTEFDIPSLWVLYHILHLILFGRLFST